MIMNNIKRKRLNNKGFTLIELLAVVVILAVVMGIAMTSVLSAMNNSRKGSLQDSATSVARAFQTKYSEAMVAGDLSTIFSDIDPNVKYAFDGSTLTTNGNWVAYEIDSNLSENLNMSAKTYVMGSSANKIGPDDSGNLTASKSFIAFDGESMVACIVAEPTGSYYVNNATTNATVEVLGKNITFADESMFACSNGKNSWTS